MKNRLYESAGQTMSAYNGKVVDGYVILDKDYVEHLAQVAYNGNSDGYRNTLLRGFALDARLSVMNFGYVVCYADYNGFADEFEPVEIEKIPEDLFNKFKKTMFCNLSTNESKLTKFQKYNKSKKINEWFGGSDKIMNFSKNEKLKDAQDNALTSVRGKAFKNDSDWSYYKKHNGGYSPCDTNALSNVIYDMKSNDIEKRETAGKIFAEIYYHNPEIQDIIESSLLSITYKHLIDYKKYNK